MITRRRFIGGLTVATGSLMLPGCDRLEGSPGLKGLLRSAEGLTMHAQRLVTDRNALAREFSEAEMSPVFRSNGTRMPQSQAYRQHLAQNFANWRLRVDGLVARPLNLTLAQVRALPARTQITRHDCVEGWSAIGKWHGVVLRTLLKAAQLSDRARYIVFHCADSFGSVPYYESIDLVDAFHPQSILAWAMNGRLLPVENGAPLRLRVERQLGYKHAKYVERVEAVESLIGVHGGRGGYWEDRSGYEWYVGI